MSRDMPHLAHVPLFVCLCWLTLSRKRKRSAALVWKHSPRRKYKQWLYEEDLVRARFLVSTVTSHLLGKAGKGTGQAAGWRWRTWVGSAWLQRRYTPARANQTVYSTLCALCTLPQVLVNLSSQRNGVLFTADRDGTSVPRKATPERQSTTGGYHQPR
jgi:hypothetical protein